MDKPRGTVIRLKELPGQDSNLDKESQNPLRGEIRKT
jgi:hypothetical protein